MNGQLLSNSLYVASTIFIIYYLCLMSFYFFFAFLGLIESRKRAWENEEEDYPLVYFSTMTPPVSIVIPARNEEIWIRDTLLSVLNINYPKFEVIVIDDGSKDRTFEVLNEILELSAIDRDYVKYYSEGEVKKVYKSKIYPFVTVVQKVSTGKKASAVNSGLNFARYKYICAIDADTILVDPDSILKVMTYVAKDPEKIIGIGSYFGLSNGMKIKGGRVEKDSFSFNPIIAYQNLEYIRSFIGNRLGWSRYNAMPIISGGFGIWRKDVLYELGGFSQDFTCEDIEMTFRAHDYIVKNKDKDYRIVMLPYPVTWTEGPENIKSLISQRNRWHRVTLETVWAYKYMLFNPRFKSFAFLTMPYLVFYEVLGVFFEIVSIAMVTIGYLLGMMDIHVYLGFFIFMALWQTVISLLSVLAFVSTQRLFKLKYAAYMIFLSFVELFWYKWIISIARLSGTISYFQRIKTFDQYQRSLKK